MIHPNNLQINEIIIVSAIIIIVSVMIKGIIAFINESGPASFLWHD